MSNSTTKSDTRSRILFYSSLFLMVLLFSSMLSSCRKDSPVTVDIPTKLQELYYFAEGSFWVYDRSNDSSASDTVRVIYQSPTTQVQLNEDGRLFEGPIPGNINGPYSADVILRHSDISFDYFQNFETGFGKGDGDWWVLIFSSGPEAFINYGSRLLLSYYSSDDRLIDFFSEMTLTLQSITVPAGTFDGYLVSDFAIRLNPTASFTGGQSNVITEISLVPGVGIVQYKIETNGFDSTGTYFEENSTWSMTNWELK